MSAGGGRRNTPPSLRRLAPKKLLKQWKSEAKLTSRDTLSPTQIPLPARREFLHRASQRKEPCTFFISHVRLFSTFDRRHVCRAEHFRRLAPGRRPALSGAPGPCPASQPLPPAEEGRQRGDQDAVAWYLGDCRSGCRHQPPRHSAAPAPAGRGQERRLRLRPQQDRPWPRLWCFPRRHCRVDHLQRGFGPVQPDPYHEGQDRASHDLNT